MRERGFTLIETLLVAAIIVIISAVAWSFSSGDRVFAVKSSTTIFDAMLAHARALAATSGGATLAFAPASLQGGVELSLSAGPAASSEPADVPPATLAADVSEASLGNPPFMLFIDAAGHATGPQPCPDAGSYTLTFAAGGASDSRTLPCPAVAAGPPQPPGTVPP